MTAPTLSPRIVPTIGNGAVLPTHKKPTPVPAYTRNKTCRLPHRLLSRMTLKANPL
jgi:hypothetical protein